ncbi:MAG: hypothetical protein EXQ47_07460 [Bryobacterales bacterium]|nr:hypothetical protein [Bryobacterales bacterium]
MKDGLALFVLGLIGIGGFLLWQAHTDAVQPVSSVTVPVDWTVPPPSPPAPKAVPLVKPPAPVVEASPVAVVVPAPEPPPTVVQPDPPPFPAVEEISSGAPAEVVTTKFGDPALSMLTSNRRRMVGTYVYARDKGREATVIRLEDGKVTSAYSKGVRAQAVGLSIPRQKRTE